MKGRRRRLRNFEKKAESFVGAISKGHDFRETTMDDRQVKVGMKQHKRLILKRMGHYQALVVPMKSFIQRLEKNPAKFFTLVELGYSKKFMIQEYRDRPTVGMLFQFFEKRFLKKSERTTQDEWEIEEALKCKRLVNQYKKISPGLVKNAFEELSMRAHEYGSPLYNFPITRTSVLVLGFNRNGTLRLALMDY
ncbi:MAG: hypothetical protein WCI04_02630 [archaeon]